ncbi:MAG: hypothetical protein M1823_005872 [Watsoniomyces obsoletus]|nr:MAG: hypothetical protein M1823_005872 [Watsoniomyces obsoletus]
MAGLRSKTVVPVGTASWINTERSTALQFIQQEAEEFTFSARNEMDWLNEHMADVFAKLPKTMTDIFKTPGKLRGKTPRTVRKRDALESRAPLTDIFAPALNTLTPAHEQAELEKSMQSAAAIASAKKNQPASSGQKSHLTGSGKENTDSGYNASDDSEFEFAPENESTPLALAGVFQGPVTHLRNSEPGVNGTPGLPNAGEDQDVEMEDAPPSDRNTHREFMLAMQAMQSNTSPSRYDEQYDTPGRYNGPIDHTAQQSPAQDEPGSAMTPDGSPLRDNLLGQTENRSPSDRSSPEQQVVRKSSLSFAALPAREPMAAKSSFGGIESNASHMDLPPSRRPGYYGSLAPPPNPDDMSDDAVETESVNADDHMHIDNEEKDVPPTKDSDEMTETKLYRKTSTQRLHERISQLGQSQPQSRPTKSFTTITQQQQPEKMMNAVAYMADHSRVSGKEQVGMFQGAGRNGDKSGIAQLKAFAAGDAGFGNNDDDDAMDVDVPAQVEYGFDQTKATLARKSAMTPAIMSPLVVTAAPRVPDGTAMRAGTALREQQCEFPQNRPIAAASTMEKSTVEGPLGASKAKLTSLLQSARGIFANSAGVSEQAKVETASPSKMPPRSRADIEAEVRRDIDAAKARREIKLAEAKAAEAKAAEAKEAAEKQLAEAMIAEQNEKDEQIRKAQEMEKAMIQQQQAPVRATKESKRPVKPGKVTAPKTKPVPVAIKVGTASQRELDQRKINPTNANLTSSLQQSTGPSAAGPSRPTLQTKPSAASLRKVTSNNTTKASTATATKPRALAAAARKKEQEEREAQRKLDAKREAERKRAAQQEEERKREQQRKEMEQQRQREHATTTTVEDATRAAQRQMIEKRRQELAKKAAEQKNAQQMRTRAGAKNEMKQPEKTQMQVPLARGELNAARPMSKINAATNLRGHPDESHRSIMHPQMNPARPLKRAAQADETEDEPYGPSNKVGQAYVQIDSKRRHTESEDDDMFGVGPSTGVPRQAMPPPMRQSNFRKDHPLGKTGYTSGYGNGSSVSNNNNGNGKQPAAGLFAHYHQQQQMKSTATIDMAKFAHGAKIPFAEGNGNAGVPSSSISKAQQPHPQSSRSQAIATSSTTKKHSSPTFYEGDAYSLPDIPTDSEDGDGLGNFVVPDWAKSPQLQELLKAQQLIDPETIFGPIPPLNLEEIFKGTTNSKDRHRFRNRTSSANWSGPDRLTQEEIQKDLEARRRLIAAGEWTFNVSS